MDISNRKSLLITINKAAQSREVSKDVVRKVREPFRSMTPADRIERLRDLRDALSKPVGQMTYTSEQQQQLASYQDLFDNWDNYKEYVNGPMQAIGDWVAEKTIVPAVKAGVRLYQGAKEDLGDEVGKPSREKAIKELEKAGAASINELVKNGNNISDLQCFEQTYSALNNNEFHKISSGKIIAEDISSALRKEFDASFEIHHKKFAKEYSDSLDLDLDTYNNFYELAVAHHILTQEGYHKDALAIDNFVINNSSIWGFTKTANWLSSAWTSVKNVVSKGVKLVTSFVGKTFKFILGKLPYLGLLFSIPFMIKNLIEAYHNGKRIISDLDLAKFGFNKMKCITPVGIGHVRDTFKRGVDKYRRDPDALKELITIFRTIGAFWIDVLFAITNGFMAVLDIIAIAGLFFPGVGWLVSIGALGGNLLLALGVAGLEIGSEYFKDHYWDKDAAYMLEEAKKAVREILSEGTPAKVEEPKFELVGDGGPPLPDEPVIDSPSVIDRVKPSITPNLTPQPAF